MISVVLELDGAIACGRNTAGRLLPTEHEDLAGAATAKAKTTS